ncbi:MAG TPA: SNF2-related protein, partial [Gemmatimonadales bacterium]
MTIAAVPPAWATAPAERVCAVIARATLGESHTAEERARSFTTSQVARDARLGGVTLRHHQLDAVARLRQLLDDAGGALLADDVGLGKTYIALAVAREARTPLVVAPASLRPTWMEAFRRTGVHAPFVSTERLSRRDAPAPSDVPHDMVIVDEAHHFRNPRTRRYVALARLVRRARVLLLSATPVHNRREELEALLALFLGSRAAALDDAGRARLVIRRTHDALPVAARPPRALPLRALPIAANDEVTRRILDVPPPVPAHDSGVAGALAVHGLLRLWASSAGALRAGSRRRLVRAESLLVALESGHHLSRAELERWAVGDDVVQPAFPELLGACDVGGALASEPDALADAVRAYAVGVRAVLAALGAEGDDAR